MLTAARVLDEAVRLLDAGGAAALSMRGLARALGVTPMSLYHHVPDREALLDQVLERLLLAGPRPDVARARDWRAAARALARSIHHVLRAHPQAAPLFTSRTLRTPVALAEVDALVGRLVDAGFGGRDALRLVDCLAALTIGHALAHGAGPRDAGAAAARAQVAALRAAGLSRVARALGRAPHDHDAELEAGVTALLDGFARQAGVA